MSDAGIRVLTDTGELQLDAIHKNFVLKRKFKLSTMPTEYVQIIHPNTGSESLCYVVTLGSNEMFFALGCKDKTKNVCCFVRGVEIYQYDDERGSEWYREQESENNNKAYVFVATSDDIEELDEDWQNNASASDIDVYVFGIDNNQVQTHGCGLAIYDENGNPVFYSGTKSMRVLHADYEGWNEAKTYQFDNQKEVAIIFTGYAEDYYVRKGLGLFDYVRCYGIKNPLNRIVPFSIFGVNESEDEGVSYHQNWLYYILVDVTNY